MGIWAEIKMALNSTLGKNLQPLDEIIKSQAVGVKQDFNSALGIKFTSLDGTVRSQSSEIKAKLGTSSEPIDQLVVNNSNEIIDMVSEGVSVLNDSVVSQGRLVATNVSRYVDESTETLDAVSKKDTAQCIYGMAHLLSMSGLASLNIKIAPREVRLAPYRCANDDTSTVLYIAPETKVIGTYSIYKCSKIAELYLPNVKEVESYGIADNPSLRILLFGKNLKRLDQYAFHSCTSLFRIFYDGTVNDWNSIEKGEGWDFGCGEYSVVCTNGTIGGYGGN